MKNSKIEKFILRFIDPINKIPIITMSFLIIYYLIIYHLLFNNILFFLFGIFCCLYAIFSGNELKVETYFHSDKKIYEKHQESTRFSGKLILSIFSVILNLVSTITYIFLKEYLNSPLVKTFAIILVGLVSIIISLWIASYFTQYDFTINYVFSNSTKFKERLWIYLKYKEDVINCIKNNKPLFTQEYISKNIKRDISFEEFEQVKKAIGNLTLKQLENILFRYNSNLIIENDKKNWKKVITVSSAISSILLFFREDVKNFVSNILNRVALSSEIIFEVIDKFIYVLGFKENNLVILPLKGVIPHKFNPISHFERILLVILISYLILFVIVVSKEKIVLYFNTPRELTIEKYLIPMMEDELQKKKLQEKIIL